MSLHRFAKRPAGDVMSRSEAEALAERIRTDVRAGASALPGVSPLALTEPTLAEVADRYLRDYARRDTRKPHAVRQFEIHVRLLLESGADTADVRDFLGHTSLTTTSLYLRSTAMRLERALRLLEESQAASERTPPMVRGGDSCSSATRRGWGVRRRRRARRGNR